MCMYMHVCKCTYYYCLLLLVVPSLARCQGAVAELISALPLCSQLNLSQDAIFEFAFHIVNESCTTVTNTAAKTAVQLVFGKANLVRKWT